MHPTNTRFIPCQYPIACRGLSAAMMANSMGYLLLMILVALLPHKSYYNKRSSAT